ncbi:MAG: hypothetical protein C4576_26790 [Desulfobacteraceae bacterium]|nr:MAG: hypothetical protein C4576_26790 [Desulfobacteraceae bacterium]
MGKDDVVDLTGLEWPLSLLRFNDILRSRPPGSLLKVRIRDPLVIERVKMIVANSGGRITGIGPCDGGFRIGIRNGSSGNSGSGSGKRKHK